MTQDLTPQEAMKRLEQHFGSREGMLTHTLTTLSTSGHHLSDVISISKVDEVSHQLEEATSRQTFERVAVGQRVSPLCKGWTSLARQLAYGRSAAACYHRNLRVGQAV